MTDYIKTTATNRKIRVLISSLRNGTLIPRPEFQRRLVWADKHKRAFLETVLKGYPFPEIYIAAGDVDANTGEGQEMLVDGQQRMNTLFEYFSGAASLKLSGEIPIPAYAMLPEAQKKAFLEYDVVVRDLGQVPIEQIKEVFRRINSTKYSLNAMEMHNARYDGEFKQCADALAEHDFFERHRVFNASDIRRMQDVRYAMWILVTVMSSYFNRDDEIEDYLSKYNSEFPQRAEVEEEVRKVLDFIDSCKLSEKCRAWKKVDLFTLIVEVHRLLIKQSMPLSPTAAAKALTKFYASVEETHPEYHKAALQATNDRGSRIRRGEIVRQVLAGEKRTKETRSGTKAKPRRT